MLVQLSDWSHVIIMMHSMLLTSYRANIITVLCSITLIGPDPSRYCALICWDHDVVQLALLCHKDGPYHSLCLYSIRAPLTNSFFVTYHAIIMQEKAQHFTYLEVRYGIVLGTSIVRFHQSEYLDCSTAPLNRFS